MCIIFAVYSFFIRAPFSTSMNSTLGRKCICKKRKTTNNMATNNIELKSIRSLSGLKFYIPDYQRGYRWSNGQVIQMLNDFKEFCKRIDNDQVKATVYVKDSGDVLICLASWFPYTRNFRLSIDTDFLGITGDYELYAPQIENMRPTDRRIPLEGVDMTSPVGNLQEETVFPADAPIPICPGKGWMLFVRRK